MKSHKVGYLLIGAVGLIIVSILTATLMLSLQYRKLFNAQDEYLAQIARSIDYNITMTTQYAQADMAGMINDPGVSAAEEYWLKTGDTSQLETEILKRRIVKNKIAKAIVVIKDNKPQFTVLSEMTFVQSDYKFDRNLLPVMDTEGNINLLLYSSTDPHGVRYGLVIDLNALYRTIVGSTIGNSEWLLLIDSQNQIVLHQFRDDVLVDDVDAISGATCDPKGFESLKTIQLEGKSRGANYKYWNPEEKVEHEARLYVMPYAETENNYFAVGIASKMDDRLAEMRNTFIVYAISAVFFVIGVAYIVTTALHSKRKEREHLEELEILREKNVEMTTLLENRAKIAHLDRLETMGVLTSSISHEFNNLLTPIMGNSILALEKLPPEDEEIGGLLEKIYFSSAKAKRLVSRMSDLSRKNTAETFTDIELNLIVKKAVESVEPAKPKTVMVSVDVHETLWVHVNELQIHQLLLNLIMNAYQALEGQENGRVVIRGEAKDNMACIHVKDNGPGIDDEIKSKIFDPFFTTKPSGKGTGLGLAICMQAAEDNKGKIELNEAYKDGCEFILKLPLIEASKETTEE